MKVRLRIKGRPSVVPGAISARTMTGESNPAPSVGGPPTPPQIAGIPPTAPILNRGRYVPPPKPRVWIYLPGITPCRGC